MFKLHKSSVHVDGYLQVDPAVGGGFDVANYNRLGQGMHLFRFVTKSDAIRFARKIARMLGIKAVVYRAKLGKLAIKL